MSHVLPGQIDRHLDLELEVDHLKGARMLVTHQVSDELAILCHGPVFGPMTSRDPGGIDDSLIEILLGHVINQLHVHILGSGYKLLFKPHLNGITL